MAIKLVVIKDKSAYDMTELLQKATWSGKKSSITRTLEFSLIDNDNEGQERPGIDVEKGNLCALYDDGVELFRGIIMNQQMSEKRIATYKAYDYAIYLANNDDTFVYKNKTATSIFTDICERFGWAYTAVDTRYIISSLTMPNTSCVDAIWSALAMTYRATGGRYYVHAKDGKLNLIRRADNIVQWVVEEGSNVISCTSSKSIENVKTRVKLMSDKNKVKQETKDEALEKVIGVFQYTEKADAKMKAAKLKTLAQTMLDNMKKPKESLSVSAMGITDVISGVAVYISIPLFGIERTFFVDEDTHSFEAGNHTMQLTLNKIADVEGSDDVENADELDVSTYPTLKKGKKNKTYVKKLQEILLSRGYLDKKYAKDGVFGKKVQAAVIEFQREHGFEPDGIVDTATWIALYTL